MKEADNAGVIAPPPLIYALGIGAGFGLDRLLPFAIGHPRWLRYGAGLPLLLCSAAAILLSLSEFRRARTAFDPAKATTSLITGGVFRVSRNPSYLSLVLLGLGLEVLFDKPWIVAMLLPVQLIMHFGVIRREERYLAGKFGEPYREYMKRVRRWI